MDKKNVKVLIHTSDTEKRRWSKYIDKGTFSLVARKLINSECDKREKQNPA